MGVAIDLVNNDVAHRLVRSVDGYPTPSLGRVLRQLIDRSWLIIRYGAQADSADPLAGQPFDLLNCGTILTARCTDSEHPESMAVGCNRIHELPAEDARHREREAAKGSS